MVVVDLDGQEVVVSWPQLHAAAARVAAHLADEGVGPGDAVLVAGTTRYETLVMLLAVWQRGAAVSLLAAGMPLKSEAMARQLQARRQLLAPRATYLDEAWVARRVGDATSAGAAAMPAPEAWPPPGVALDAVAVYQATSGTTGQPRVVPVTWRMLVENLRALTGRLSLSRHDSFVSWLPLYHDMGLVFFVALPAFLGAGMMLVPPERFARSPGILAAAVERRRATLTGGPTFGVALLERSLQRAAGFDLSSLRHFVCGAEMIDVDVCRRAVATGARHGLRSDVFAFGYGLAEATLAVSLRESTPVDAAADTSATVTATGAGQATGRPTDRPLARLGAPLAGVELRVVDPASRQPLPDREVGEIEVRGPSVMAGYVGMARSESGLDEDGDGGGGSGWLRTGDLGYLADGELVVAGRSKDVVVVGGRNFLPHDIEQLVGALPGIREGRVAAVQIDGPAGEGLAVLAERSRDPMVHERDVRAAVRHELDIVPQVVAFVSRSSLPRTTSGKLRRHACRQLVDQLVEEPNPSDELEAS